MKCTRRFLVGREGFGDCINAREAKKGGRDSLRIFSRFAAPGSIELALGLAIGSAGIAIAHPGHEHVPVALVAAAKPPTVREDRALVAEARLEVRILDDETGLPTAARVRITDAQGRPLGLGQGISRLALPGSAIGLPAEAIGIMYGRQDRAEGYAFQPDGSFYARGGFTLPMPGGEFTLSVSKGFEYIRARETLRFRPGTGLERTIRLRQWIDMPARGWYSGDDHIHVRRSPRENPLLADWLAAEDVHVGVLLQMGDYAATYYSQYGWGADGRYAAGGRLLLSGQEDPRTSVIGHTLSIGARGFVRFADDYFSFDRVFDEVHALGGLTGYAHQGMSFHGYRGMALDVPDGKIDFLELMQFCVPEGPLAAEHYYRFLDLGFRLTALAGSDFPWCGRGGRPGEEEIGPQIGSARFYAQVGQPFTYEKWFAAVAAGRTFVTTGPMVELEVNRAGPGETVDLQPGQRVTVVARAFGDPAQMPLTGLQIIGHSRVLAEVNAGAPGQSPGEMKLEFEFTPEHGLWLGARAEAGKSDVAHTTPVYITIGGGGFHDPARLAVRIAETRRHLQEIRAELAVPSGDALVKAARSAPGPWAYGRSRERLENRIAAVERQLEELGNRK